MARAQWLHGGITLVPTRMGYERLLALRLQHLESLPGEVEIQKTLIAENAEEGRRERGEILVNR